MSWHRTRLLSRRLELIGDDGQLYGRLSMLGAFGSLARTDMAGISLDLKWSMFRERGVTVFDSGTKEKICVLRLTLFNKGQFEFTSGRTYGFKMSLLRRKCTITNDLGEVLFTMTSNTWRSRTKVVLGSGLADRKEVSIMIPAVQYAILMVYASSY